MEPSAKRVHHSYIWLGGLKAFLATLAGIAVAAASSLPAIVSGLRHVGPMMPVPVAVLAVLGVILACILLIGIFALGFWFSWRHLGYEVGDSEFSLYKGVFSKKRLHVPYQRIQSVDVRASLLQRVAGVCSVEIDTAGGSSNKAIVVPYVTKDAAGELRHELFARKQAILAGAAVAGDVPRPVPATKGEAAGNVLDELGGVFSDVHGVFDEGSFAEPVAPSFEARLSNKELVLSGLSDVKSASGAVLLGIVGVAGFAFGFAPVAEALSRWVDGLLAGSALAGHTAASVAMAIAMRLVPALVVGVVCGALVIAALSAISSVLSYGDFCVRRRGSRIEVERGLLQHQTQGVDVDRVQFVRVEHGWIRRKLGYCKVYLGRIDSVAANDGAGNSSMSTESSAGMVVHPFLKTSDLPGLLSGIVPELDCFFEGDISCVPPVRARHRAVVRSSLWRSAGFWVLLALVLLAVCLHAALSLWEPGHLAVFWSLAMSLWPLILVLLVDMAVGVVRGLKWHAGSSLSYSDKSVRIVNEGFTRTEVVVPRRKIQFACLRANPLQAMAKVRCVLITTAAGTGSTSECLYDVDEKEASAFLDWTRPRR